MTFSLGLVNGDLAPQGSQLSLVSGQNKLQQDLTLWLLCRLGSNRWHPAFGSYLQSYIGGIVGPSTQTVVYNEILRTLKNYQELVWALFTANPQLFSLSELPYSIDSINTTVTYDTVYATVQVSNPSATTQVTISPSSL